MKILAIPDIHGRNFWRDPVNMYINEVDQIVFTGDYFDPYPDSGIQTFEDMVINFKEIIKLKKNNPNKVILLYGNHDYHYANAEFDYLTRSTRYDKWHAKQLIKLFNDNDNLFQLCHQVKTPNKTIMFTHAGITKFWLNLVNIPLDDNLCDNINKLNNEDGAHDLAIIGRYRTFFGEKTGSPIWCDLHEFAKDEGLDNIFQVFGHTRLKEGKFYKTDNYACIDCQRCFLIDDKCNLEMIEY